MEGTKCGARILKELYTSLYILYIYNYIHVFGGMISSKWMYLHFETLCLWPSSERISHCLADPILPSFKWKPASDTAKGDVMKIEIWALWLRDWKTMAFTRPRYPSPRTAQTSFTRCQRPWSGKAAIRSMKGEMPTPPASSSSATLFLQGTCTVTDGLAIWTFDTQSHCISRCRQVAQWPRPIPHTLQQDICPVPMKKWSNMGATEVRKWSSPADKPSACLATDAIHWQMASMTTAPTVTSRCIGFWPSPLCSRRGISSQWIDLSHRAQGQETSEWPWRSHARRRRAWTEMMRPNEWSRRGCRNHDAPTAARRFPTKCLLRLQLPQSHWQAQGCSSNLAPQGPLQLTATGKQACHTSNHPPFWR